MTDSSDPAETAWLERCLADFFPPPCAFAWRRPSSPIGELPPAEAAAILQAVERRKAEFAAGRNSARQALAAVGFPGAVIPSGPDRAPVWPAGTVGSIAHADGMAVAVAARSTQVGAIGIDIERTGRVREELWSHILTPAELKDVQSLPAADRVRRTTAVFTVKEAFYKFQYPRTLRWLDFADVEVALTGPGDIFVVRAAAAPAEFSGSVRIGPVFTLAGIHLRLA